jgi:predicted Zn-dependent peptidase
VPWSSSDVGTSYVANALIGCSSAGFAAPGRGMFNRATTNILQKNSFVERAFGLNSHFTDSGLFGIAIEGAGSHSSDLMHLATDELNKLKAGQVTEEELNRTKNILKADIL